MARVVRAVDRRARHVVRRRGAPREARARAGSGRAVVRLRAVPRRVVRRRGALGVNAMSPAARDGAHRRVGRAATSATVVPPPGVRALRRGPRGGALLDGTGILSSGQPARRDGRPVGAAEGVRPGARFGAAARVLAGDRPGLRPVADAVRVRMRVGALRPAVLPGSRVRARVPVLMAEMPPTVIRCAVAAVLRLAALVVREAPAGRSGRLRLRVAAALVTGVAVSRRPAPCSGRAVPGAQGAPDPVARGPVRVRGMGREQTVPTASGPGLAVCGEVTPPRRPAAAGPVGRLRLLTIARGPFRAVAVPRAHRGGR